MFRNLRGKVTSPLPERTIIDVTKSHGVIPDDIVRGAGFNENSVTPVLNHVVLDDVVVTSDEIDADPRTLNLQVFNRDVIPRAEQKSVGGGRACCPQRLAIRIVTVAEPDVSRVTANTEENMNVIPEAHGNGFADGMPGLVGRESEYGKAGAQIGA